MKQTILALVLAAVVMAGFGVRARAGGPVQCMDGTKSPTCVEGGSMQGCCSGHGGVDHQGGCGEEPPTE